MIRATINKGISAAELVIAMAIMGSAAYLVKVSVVMVNNLYFRTAIVETQRRSELTLYSIAREVRNARLIMNVAPDQVTLQTFDRGNGYDSRVNPEMFDLTNLSTTTFQFRDTGTETFIEKRETRNGKTSTTKLLKNLLVRPDDTHFLFRGQLNETETPPGVDICLRIDPRRIYNQKKEFSLSVMKRTRD